MDITVKDKEKANNRTPSKVVYCYETKEKFIGLTQAARFCNLKDKKSISNVLDNPNKVAGGYHWCTSLELLDGIELKYPTNNLPIEVYCYETREKFSSLSDASKKFGCSSVSKISEVLNKLDRTVNGFHFCTSLSLFDEQVLIKNGNKRIYCYETKQWFESLKEASEFFGISTSSISNVLDVENKTSDGKHFCTSPDVFDDIKLTKDGEERYIEVYCYETKEKFSSLKEAAEKYNIFSGGSISRVINDPTRECGEKHWCTDLSMFDGVELTNNKLKVYCYETKQEFGSIGEATRFFGLVSPMSIYEFLNSPNRTAAGKHFCTSLDVFDGVELTDSGKKVVYCYETKQRFDSLLEAKKFSGVSRNTSSTGYVDNPRATLAGKHWCTSLDVFDGVELIYPSSGTSSYEKELLEFLESYNIENIITNTRKIISPLELDIYLPDYNLAIEFNGNYWHSDEYKDKNYHQEKTLKCLEKGIKLIQIFEHQWLEKKEIFKSVILNHIGTSNRIYARKCKVVELDNVTYFLDNNHLQGSCGSTVKLGLVYNNELVSVMTFGKSRFNKKYDYELIRFCNKLNTSVVGGASKLLSYFKNKYSSSIISYANLQWSDGNLYDKIGFIRTDVSSPNYWWIKKDLILPRYKCQKHKLKKLMETLNLPYDETGSELSIMKNAGFVKVYDCGNICFEYRELI